MGNASMADTVGKRRCFLCSRSTCCPRTRATTTSSRRSPSPAAPLVGHGRTDRGGLGAFGGDGALGHEIVVLRSRLTTRSLEAGLTVALVVANYVFMTQGDLRCANSARVRRARGRLGVSLVGRPAPSACLTNNPSDVSSSTWPPSGASLGPNHAPDGARRLVPSSIVQAAKAVVSAVVPASGTSRSPRRPMT